MALRPGITSARTQADAIHLLAESLRAHRAGNETSFDHLLMVLMPNKRSAMHLDTIFTRISGDECLVYPPYFLQGSRELLNVTSIDLRHDGVEEAARWAMGLGKFTVMLGGEHSITPAAVRAAKERWPDLTVLQLDAHADLRDEYRGSLTSESTPPRLVAC